MDDILSDSYVKKYDMDDSTTKSVLTYLGTESKIATIVNELKTRNVDADHVMIENIALVPVNPIVCKEAMAAHLSRINDCLEVGQFEFDYDDAGFGSIIHRFRMLIKKSDLTNSVKMKVQTIPILIIDIYGDGIWNICRAAASAENEDNRTDSLPA